MRITSLKIAVAALAATALLAGCATAPEAPGPPPAATSAPEPEPPEPLACGAASYYADSLSGNATASGEPYDPARLTAAHRTLPFGARLLVVRAGTEQAVEVTVNDRGPFVPGRIIDLSRAAAARIGLVTDGIGDVCLFDADAPEAAAAAAIEAATAAEGGGPGL